MADLTQLVFWDPNFVGFPPDNAPEPIPPVAVPTSVLRPFNIPDQLFIDALDYKVPLTIAALYAVTVKSLNVYNKARGKKPWSISKTRVFHAFVLLHNIFLAVYSAWTFWGTLGVMKRSIPSPMGPRGLVGTLDSFCRLHGRVGPGNSIWYDEASSSFISADQSAPIVNGIPSRTEMGRMWNEGLAYYGWLFYLSKFYEVFDTFIILAKGKPSSTLQTYHHAGAMLSMWAGIRYMSSPIWLFVLFNSFIHSLMYVYYTLTALSIKVPTPIKRTLTTMQITQFLVGGLSALLHSFFSYSAPITVKSSDAKAATETRYLTQPCIMTTGENWAIWLIVGYLAPLTYLFVSFFIASYVKRSMAATKRSGKNAKSTVDHNAALAEKAGWDAAKGIEKEVYGGESMTNGSSDENTTTPKKSKGRAQKRA